MIIRAARKLILCCGLFCFNHLMGTTQTIGLRYPKILLPSPNSAELGRYGDIPVGNSTGNLNLSIPLLQLSTRNLNIPVSLNYSSNGLRVNAIASRAGFDWILNAGGVITRQVFDEPDLDPQTVRLTPPNFNNKDQALYNYLQASTGLGNDTQPDIFSISTDDISCRFVVNDAGIVVPVSYSNLKIEYNFNTGSTFTVTTSKGVKYYFGGTGATEYSKITSNAECGGAGHIAGTDVPVANAWYLTKIEHPDGDVVTFLYESADNFYLSNISQTLTRANPFNGGVGPCNMTCPEPIYNQICETYVESDVVRIKEIAASGIGKIMFTYKARTDIDGTDGLVATATLYDVSNTQIKKAVLDHTNDMATVMTGGVTSDRLVRPFLTKVSLYGMINSIPKEYSLFYKDLGNLPARASFAQDYEGYFNGQTNTALVPKSVSYSTQILFNNIGGNRNPSADYATKGMLNKIIYPTGGRSEIIYEGNDSYLTEEIQSQQSVSKSAIGNDNAYYNDEHIIGTQNFTPADNQEITLNASFGHSSGVVDGDNHIRMVVELINNTTGLPEFSEVVLQNESKVFNHVGITGGITYSLKVDVFGYNGYTGAANLSYTTSQSITHNKEMPGVRVSRVTAYDAGANLPEIKRYIYRHAENMNKSSGYAITPAHVYISSLKTVQYCTGGTYIQEKECNYTTLHSSTIASPNGLTANGILYKSVLVSRGENYEVGGTEFKYSVNIDGGSYNIMGDDIVEAPYTNNGFDNGTLLFENDFKWINNSISYVRKKEYLYKNDSRIYQKVSGIMIRQKYSITGMTMLNPPQNMFFLPFDVAGYDIHSYWYYLEKINTTEYDQAGQNPVVSTVDYMYENTQHAELTKTKITDSKNEVVTIQTRYPQDVTASGSEETARQGLIAQGRTGTIIEESTTRGTLDEKKRQVFRQWPSGKIQPEKIRVNSGPNGAFEDRLEFTNYSTKGNLLEVRKSNNHRLSYIWGYSENLPIAEATNASHNEIFFDNFEEQTGWDTWGLSYDQSRAHTGRVSAKITASTSSEVVNLSTKWLTIALTAPKKFRYSGWIYSDGPTTEIFFFMKTASEAGYFTHVDAVGTDVTGKWVYLEKEYTVPADITQLNIRIDNNGSGNVWFDDIRLHPSEAQMTTYTYDPLIGQTSQTDINNRVTYYEYDKQGRLSLVRDNDRNIVRRICYNYANQPEDCPVDATPLWQASGNIRCQPCPSNGNYVTNIQEHQEIDNNVNSSSYGTYRWVSDGVAGNCGSGPDWQNTATAIRCSGFDGINTGEREQEQQDMNPCSGLGTRWVVIDQNCSMCPKAGRFEATGITRCQLDGNGNNTGYREMRYVNTESCSANYLAEMWAVYTYEPGQCPVPVVCNSESCSGNDKKCINGVCETGVWTCVSSTRLTQTTWRVTRRYKFSDGSFSTYYEETVQTGGCFGPLEP